MGYFRKQVTRYIDAISCDGSGCLRAFYEDEDDATFTIQTQALREGWVIEYPQWFCPACATKKSEAGR